MSKGMSAAVSTIRVSYREAEMSMNAVESMPSERRAVTMVGATGRLPVSEIGANFRVNSRGVLPWCGEMEARVNLETGNEVPPLVVMNKSEGAFDTLNPALLVPSPTLGADAALYARVGMPHEGRGP